MKKARRLYNKMTLTERCLCPVCHRDSLVFITDNGMKHSYSKVIEIDPKLEKAKDQFVYKCIQCINCGVKYLIDWETDPISYAYVGGITDENSKH